MTTPLTRQPILAALRAALEPLPYVHAMWEGGAAAFNRVDEWSDIDLQIAVDDGREGELFPLIEDTLTALSPITLKYEIPQPTWHGHFQNFYRLRDTTEFLMIDFVVMKRSATQRFLEPEIHGHAVVHFDKIGFVQVPPLDMDAHRATLAKRVQTLKVMFPLFQSLVTKEIHRKNGMEAMTFYTGYTLRPLVEAIRLKHDPTRYNFHTRYLYYDFPPDVVKRLEPLFFPANLNDLRAKREEAERWFGELIETF